MRSSPGPVASRDAPWKCGLTKFSIDWKKTFEAAKTAGVKNYFVEQNMELTRESVAALKAMKV